MLQRFRESGARCAVRKWSYHDEMAPLENINSETQNQDIMSNIQQQQEQEQQQKITVQQTDTQNGCLRGGGGEWFGWGARHTVAFLLCVGLIVDYMVQSIMGVTIVAMVGSAGLRNGTAGGDVCPLPDGQNFTDVMRVGDFNWNEQTQGLIIGSINIGSLLAAFPGGRMPELYGGKMAFGVMLTCTALLCFLLPIAAYTSMWLFMFLRVLQGTTLAGLFSSMNVIIVNWFPPQERPKFFSIVLTGTNLGTVTCTALSGWLSSMEWLGGWPAVFYVVGASGVVWSVLWFTLVHSTPEDHPTISQKELSLILDGGRRADKELDRATKKKCPWGAVFRSPAVWVQAITAGAECFNAYIVINMVPSFLANIQYFSLETAGVVAALPYLLSIFVSVGWGCVVGRLMSSNILDKRRIKQLSTAMGFYIPAACMFGMTQVGCNSDLSVALLIMCVGAGACNYAGFQSTYQDLSPTYCGTLMGLGQLMASTAAVLGPLVSGFMINNSQTTEAWSHVFLTSAIIYLVFCTLYLFYTPVQQQPWDKAVINNTSNTPQPPDCRYKSYDDQGSSKKAVCDDVCV